ncbi:hypothetical protein [Enterovibrio norvegicus]|uniref:hypothetical protein n=1 Tax=Enterovibrio norvegicus TaxID=188144 RepID=UPI001056C86A|nr:hypothetical protein [Enterovibrio norvegicus]
MNFNQAASLYKLGVLPSEKMVDVAISALESGSDEEAIVMLAIETDKTLGTLKPLFEECLRVLNLDALSNKETLEYAAQHYASLANSGAISEVEFGFKVGSFHDEYKLEGMLWDAFQNAMWYEEAPYEYGYPKYLESNRAFQAECLQKIRIIIERYSA